MNIIKKSDFIESIATALQYISHYHSEDFIVAMSRAFEIEESAPAKDAIFQILSSSKLSPVNIPIPSVATKTIPLNLLDTTSSIIFGM